MNFLRFSSGSFLVEHSIKCFGKQVNTWKTGLYTCIKVEKSLVHSTQENGGGMRYFSVTRDKNQNHMVY